MREKVERWRVRKEREIRVRGLRERERNERERRESRSKREREDWGEMNFFFIIEMWFSKEKKIVYSRN